MSLKLGRLKPILVVVFIKCGWHVKVKENPEVIG